MVFFGLLRTATQHPIQRERVGKTIATDPKQASCKAAGKLSVLPCAGVMQAESSARRMTIGGNGREPSG
jgi:hypothetical protein